MKKLLLALLMVPAIANAEDPCKPFHDYAYSVAISRAEGTSIYAHYNWLEDRRIEGLHPVIHGLFKGAIDGAYTLPRLELLERSTHITANDFANIQYVKCKLVFNERELAGR